MDRLLDSRRALPAGLLALLAVEGLMVLLVGPLSVEPESPSLLQVLRQVSAYSLVFLLPGLPFARLLLRCDRATPARVLGLGAVLSALFHVALLRVAHLLSLTPTPGALWTVVALGTAAGLLLLHRRRATLPPLRRHRLFSFELALGAGIILLFVAVNWAQITRPLHRHFPEPYLQPFLNYQQVPGSTLQPGPEFRRSGPGAWALDASRGTLQIRHAAGAASFPLRLIVFGAAGVEVQVCGPGAGCAWHKTWQLPDHSVPPELIFPTYKARLLRLDVPPRTRQLRLDAAPHHGRLLIEDYSNLSEPRRRQRFEQRNTTGGVAMWAEALLLRTVGWRFRDLLLDHSDMVFGYLQYTVPEMLAGTSLPGTHVGFLLAVLLCFLLVCDLLHHNRPTDHRLVFLFPAIALLSTLMMIVVSFGCPYLPDAHFTLFLLLVLVFLLAGDQRAFLLSTVPALLSRTTGVGIVGLMLAARALSGGSPRELLKLAARCLLLWAGVFALLTRYKLRHFDLFLQSVSTFRQYLLDTRAATALQVRTGRAMFLRQFFLSTSGQSLFLLLPGSKLGRLMLLVVLGYSLVLISSHYQPLYRFVPLVFFCAIGAGANTLSYAARGRRLPVLISVVLSYGLQGLWAFFR